MTELYKKNGLVFIPAGITVEEVEKLKKENAELKTRWECRNKYMCNENGKAVPCYIHYGCLNCQFSLEKEVKDSEVERRVGGIDGGVK